MVPLSVDLVITLCRRVQPGHGDDRSSRRPRPDPAIGQVKHRGGYRNGVPLAPRQQGGVVGQLPGVDLPCCDPAQGVMRGGQLLAFPVLAAREFDAGPDPVFFSVLDRIPGAESLLRQRAPPQTLQPTTPRLAKPLL
jgi:hypothetical protein